MGAEGSGAAPFSIISIGLLAHDPPCREGGRRCSTALSGNVRVNGCQAPHDPGPPLAALLILLITFQLGQAKAVGPTTWTQSHCAFS